MTQEEKLLSALNEIMKEIEVLAGPNLHKSNRVWRIAKNAVDENKMSGTPPARVKGPHTVEFITSHAMGFLAWREKHAIHISDDTYRLFKDFPSDGTVVDPQALPTYSIKSLYKIYQSQTD